MEDGNGWSELSALDDQIDESVSRPSQPSDCLPILQWLFPFVSFLDGRRTMLLFGWLLWLVGRSVGRSVVRKVSLPATRSVLFPSIERVVPRRRLVGAMMEMKLFDLSLVSAGRWL